MEWRLFTEVYSHSVIYIHVCEEITSNNCTRNLAFSLIILYLVKVHNSIFSPQNCELQSLEVYKIRHKIYCNKIFSSMSVIYESSVRFLKLFKFVKLWSIFPGNSQYSDYVSDSIKHTIIKRKKKKFQHSLLIQCCQCAFQMASARTMKTSQESGVITSKNIFCGKFLEENHFCYINYANGLSFHLIYFHKETHFMVYKIRLSLAATEMCMG